MQQQIIATFSPVAISSVIVAIIMAASRLAPFTKPYWTFFPKVVQTWLPSLVAGLPAAVNAFESVKLKMPLPSLVAVPMFVQLMKLVEA